MENVMSFVSTYVAPHWPFFAWMFLAMLVGQVFKNTLWTKRNAINKKPHWFWWWAYKTMVLHPVVAGVCVGLVWQNPEGSVNGVVESMFYFAVSGGLSTWAYEFVKNLAKSRAGVELSLPGISKSDEGGK